MNVISPKSPEGKKGVKKRKVIIKRTQVVNTKERRSSMPTKKVAAKPKPAPKKAAAKPKAAAKKAPAKKIAKKK